MPQPLASMNPPELPRAWLLFPERMHPAHALTLRRVLLGLSIVDAAGGAGVKLIDARKAHSPVNAPYPFVLRAQEKLAAFYTRMEIERGQRTTPADGAGDGGDDPGGNGRLASDPGGSALAGEAVLLGNGKQPGG